jgi:Flp pilus assembly protein protease CpaA
MSTVVLIPTIMFFIYHIFNVYTDVKFRITKNIWHLLFLVIGLVYYYVFAFTGEWYRPLVAMLIALIIGLLLEGVRLSSPGDTKMFVVTALLLSMMLPHHWYVRVALAVVVFHLFLLSLFTYSILFKRFGVKQTFKNQINDIRALFTPGVPISRERIFEHFPGAVTIMVGSLTYFVVVTVLEKIYS